MKKLVIIALSLSTFMGFAQEGKKEAMMERLTKRKEQSPENRAEIETKQLDKIKQRVNNIKQVQKGVTFLPWSQCRGILAVHPEYTVKH